jgi:hypothetical protein
MFYLVNSTLENLFYYCREEGNLRNHWIASIFQDSYNYHDYLGCTCAEMRTID